MIKKMFSSELGRGTIILFITMNLFNFLNFAFHFGMGRLLGPANYGVLAVLMSIIYIFGIPTEAIQNIITKYTSKFNAKKQEGKINFLMRKSLRKGLKISIILFTISIILGLILAKFLKINFWLILLTNTLIFTSLSLPISRGVLQGRKKFSALGNSMVIESGIKLFCSISLVMIGLSVFGAMIGVIIGVCAGLVFSLFFNSDILKSKQEKTEFNEIYNMSKPYFITMIVVLLIFSIDVILAKRFFSPEIAGQYAVLSMLGKMIFFGTVAISKAMFPLVSEKKEQKADSKGLFKKSLLIIGAICLISIIVYFLFPELIIKILYGKDYTEMAQYLFFSGLAFTFLSLSNLILIYKLSIDKLKKSYLLFIFLILEIILLSIFNDSIKQYILAFMFSNIIMFIGSIFLGE